MKPNDLSELDDQAVVRVSREGGVAYIQALARPREILVAQCSPGQRKCVLRVLSRALPKSAEQEAGRGDQRFYRIELHDPREDRLLLVPEDQAPEELVRLWDQGPWDDD